MEIIKNKGVLSRAPLLFESNKIFLTIMRIDISL